MPQLYAGTRVVARFDSAASVPPVPMRIVVSEDRLPVTLPTGVTCAAPIIYDGDLVDRFLVWVNPKGNGRRTAKAAFDCQP